MAISLTYRNIILFYNFLVYVLGAYADKEPFCGHSMNLELDKLEKVST